MMSWLILLLALAHGHRQVDVLSARFAGRPHSSGPNASSTLLAHTQDTGIHADLLGNASALLLFGQMPAAHARGICSRQSADGLHEDRDEEARHSTAEAHGTAHTLQVQSYLHTRHLTRQFTGVSVGCDTY